LRAPLRCLATGLLTLALAACTEPAAPERLARPTIVLISIDTLRRDHLGLYGYERDTTPQIDRFAREECVVFDNSYAVSPWTLITHMSMFSGLHPDQHGVVESDKALSGEVPTLPERLDALGYHTVAVFQRGWIHERHGFDRGFDVFVDHRRMGDMLEHYHQAMAERPRDAPLFLFLHIWDVHAQDLYRHDSSIYDPPPPYDTLFLPDARERLKGIPAKDVFYAKAPVTPEQREALVALYDGNIRQADDTIGAWLAQWRELDLLDDALVIITSDHGEALGQREGLGGHGQLYQEALRTPLIVHFPGGVLAGTRRSEFVSQVDYLPTILEVLEVAPEGWLPGLPLGGGVPRDRMLFFDRPPSRGVLRWPWKLTWSDRSGPGFGRLVNLESDPGELRRVGRKHKQRRDMFNDIAEKLTGAADAQRRQRPPHPGQADTATAQTPDEVQALQALGYLGDG